MASLYWIGAQTSLSAFLQAGLRTLGYRFTTGMESAQMVILSSLVPLDAERLLPQIASVQMDETLQLIRRLPSEPNQIEKLVFLSSAQIYGEGEYLCGDCGPIACPIRTPQQLEARRWEPLCPICGEMLMPLPIAEASPLRPQTLAGQKWAADEQALMEIQPQLTYPVISLRLFHPYWPDASFISDQHPDVIAACCQQLLTEQPPNLYEDGNQMRDVTHGQDIVQVLDQVMQTSFQPGYHPFNIGSGQRVVLFQLVAQLQDILGKTHVPYTILQQYRQGDIRHRFANITKAQQALGYQPQYDIIEGLADFVAGLQSKVASDG